MSKHLIFLSVLFNALTSLSHAELIDFNSAGQLSNNFNFVTTSGVQNYAQSPVGGVGNSGSVAFLSDSSDETTAILNTGSFDFSSVGTKLQISMFFRPKESRATPEEVPEIYKWSSIKLGFSASSSTGFSLDTPGNQFFAAGLGNLDNNSAPGFAFTPFFQTGYPSGGTGTTTPRPPGEIELLSSAIYKVSATFENLGYQEVFENSGLFPLVAMSLSVDNYGAEGDFLVSRLFDVTRNEILPFNPRPEWWAGFLRTSANGAEALDNFEVAVVPEPSAIALVAFGLALVFLRGL
jgi:hypothetical protein